MTSELFTPANLLTISRMVLVPIVALCMLYGHPGWALATFLVAALTDLLDGLIARWIGQQTTLGAWLDPMADKLLLLTVFVILTLPGFGLTHRLPVWLTVLVISRDVGIVLTVTVINLAVAPRTFSPSPLATDAEIAAKARCAGDTSATATWAVRQRLISAVRRVPRTWMACQMTCARSDRLTIAPGWKV